MSVRGILGGLVGLGTGSGLTYLLINKSTKTTKVNETLAPYNGADKALLSKVKINPKDFFAYGFPGPIHDLHDRGEFISCYNRQTRNPYWVLEHITPESLDMRNGDRKNSFFKEDESIPELFRAQLKDYFRSGFDRGHQAPAADAKYSQEAMDGTFYLTNMSPQVGEGFNRDYWSHFEYFCRGLTKRYGSVRIMTGPLYLPKKDPIDGKFKVTYEMIGNPPNIAVPTHFFKLIIAEKPLSDPKMDGISVAAFVMPNEKISNETKLLDFHIPVNALERSTGLELLRNYPENKKRALCKEVNCQLIVRDFSKANNNYKKNKALPSSTSFKK
ncbi:ribonuclease NDAI_0F04650 [Naumovozyma dairenensis CBS 421]|uniref:Endonuclease n=1 Tax=Naumovozyma dairenensis (strain ATCC 10597 / BCRC 20456 / CBS 421 / NBRC 0211 / NRRL Y-12639) TaxID=1071378 RepID=G0WDC2_NAUDC|nr:hypothetical protein NDAI_0F04650 [Naumovozyma dairenensis CBS 421]CCD25783.1 hypothetical protein NDAI_0F04650 [Naumovozyma dairenensis CBS 421]